MIDGFIFDVYPDYNKDVMVIWLCTSKGARKIEQSYQPSFFVRSDASERRKMTRMLQDLPQVDQVIHSMRKTQLGSDKEKPVLQIIPTKLEVFHQLAQMIDSWGKFHRYQLYNVDLRLPTRFLQEKNLFFNAFVSHDHQKFILNDDQWAIDYPHPPLKLMHVDINTASKHHVVSYNEPIGHIDLGRMRIEEGNETDTILQSLRYLHKVDPDILLSKKGDSFLFPLLLHRAQIHNLDQNLLLGRDQSALVARKKDQSYMSYGRILYRPAFYTLRGRFHIDALHSFFYREAGWYGLFDVSRCANISAQLLSRLGAGTAISQMQVNKALQQRYLIPWKKNQPESWKTAAHLLCADRGGVILDPVVGLHEAVVELDYASLYPNIMVNHNISPETLLCSCCPSSSRRVPQIGYHICTKKTGLIPQVLAPVIKRRFLFKARSKNNQFDINRYQGLQQAWKWILLVCFGYTGYRNARYGRIECHESITAFSRSMLLTAMQLVEHAGYEVLHGIVDSLWIKEKKPRVQPFLLSRQISKKTGVRLDVEGKYQWIVFLPSKQTGLGALNRYYGLFEDQTLKARGMELRQHSTPSFFSRMQKKMLQVFAEARNAEEFQQLIPEALSVAKTSAQEVMQNKVPPVDLLFTTTISKEYDQYKINTAAKAALLQLRKMKVMVHPGQSVKYCMTQHDAKDLAHKVCIAELVSEETSIDTLWYLRFLSRCVESLLLPFGYDLDTVYQWILQKMRMSS